VPASNRLRLDQNKHLLPPRPDAARQDLEEFVERLDLGSGMLAFQDGELLTEGEILHHQVVMSTKDSEDGSKPEANQVEHGAKVTARRPFALVLMLLISKTDGLVTRDRWRTFDSEALVLRRYSVRPRNSLKMLDVGLDENR
jgi:hypothetical protein